MTQYLSPLVSCLICREVKSAKGLFTHILHSHDQQWKEEWRRLNGENLIIGNLVQRKIIDARREKYKETPNICSCGTPKTWERKNNKYCSSSCAVSQTNKNRGPVSEEQKRKTSLALKDKPRKMNYCSVNFHKCTQCDNIILSKGKSPKRKTCSRECQIHASVGMRSYTNGRRLNIYYQKKDGSTILLESSWEEKLAKFLDAHDIDWIRPKYIKYQQEGISRIYYPDFLLVEYGLYIDPKNPTALKTSIQKMDIVSNIIPLWYGDIDGIIDAIPLVRAVGFEPTTRIFAPAPKAGGMNQTIRRSD